MTIDDIYEACGGRVPVWMEALIYYANQQDSEIMATQTQMIGVVGNISNTLSTADANTLAEAKSYTDSAITAAQFGSSSGVLDAGTF